MSMKLLPCLMRQIRSGLLVKQIRCVSSSSFNHETPNKYVLQKKILPMQPLCKMHTQGDQELTEFLVDEIKLEKSSTKSETNLLQLPGFTLEKCENCEISFVKKLEDEVVRVTVNVNDSIDVDSMPYEEEYGEQNLSKSKPTFVVEIDKGNKKSILIHCNISSAVSENEGGELTDDVLEVLHVSCMPSGEEQKENDFSLSGNVMDPNMYDMLLNMLEERGIDADFVERLVVLCTTHEHNMYIGFLENLHDFLKSK